MIILLVPCIIIRSAKPEVGNLEQAARRAVGPTRRGTPCGRVRGGVRRGRSEDARVLLVVVSLCVCT